MTLVTGKLYKVAQRVCFENLERTQIVALPPDPYRLVLYLGSKQVEPNSSALWPVFGRWENEWHMFLTTDGRLIGRRFPDYALEDWFTRAYSKWSE